MDASCNLNISCYKTIAVINEAHNIFLVQHQISHKIFIKKILDIYNLPIYVYLRQNKITGIPQVIEIYEENHRLTVIEEYISGVSLQELMVTGQLSAASVSHYICDLCDILEKFHSLPVPIIHRDIKPSNIIITPCSHAILIDFNAAKYLTNINSTDTMLLGTKGYAAPEQYGFGSSTPQTDIYALGILLKELTSALPAPTDAFTQIINKCIQIDPSNRFESVSSLKQEIQGKSKNPQNTSSDSCNWRLFLPPGYRTMTPWKMVMSTSIYLFISWFFLSMDFETISASALWLERISCLFIVLLIIFFNFNYCNMQRFWPLCNSKNPIIHYIGILLLDVFMALSLFTMMIILEYTLFT